MRWNIHGSYWYSDEFLSQLKEIIRYYHSGERQVDSITHMHARGYQRKTGKAVTVLQLMEIKAEVRQQVRDCLKDCTNRISVDQQISEQLEEYRQGMCGDVKAMRSLWLYLEDDDRLKLTLHLWEQRQAYKLDPTVWAEILRCTWQRGKVGCLLLEAKLAPKTVAAMFSNACGETLMKESFGIAAEWDIFRSLPEKFVAWRGVSSNQEHQTTGYSWTLDRNQACWFAYRSASASNGNPILIQATVCRDAMMAVFAYEQEVVVNSQSARAISDVQLTELPRDKDGTYCQHYVDQLAVEEREVSIEAV